MGIYNTDTGLTAVHTWAVAEHRPTWRVHPTASNMQQLVI